MNVELLTKVCEEAWGLSSSQEIVRNYGECIMNNGKTKQGLKRIHTDDKCNKESLYNHQDIEWVAGFSSLGFYYWDDKCDISGQAGLYSTGEARYARVEKLAIWEYGLIERKMSLMKLWGNLGGHSSSDKSLSGNEGDMTLQSVYDLCLSLCAQVSDQAKEIQHLKAHITKLKKQAKPVIKHHRAWLKSVSLKQRLTRKKQRVPKESVSKQGRKFAKDVLSTDKEKVSTDKEKVSTDKDKVSTDRPIVSTDESKVSTDRQIEGTNEQKVSTDEQIEGTDEQRKDTDDHSEEGNGTQVTQTPTSTIIGDDETTAKVLLNMSQAKAVSREKEKGVELKDIEEIDRPRPTSTRSLLTLKPLPKIDLKDKGKKKIEEEDETDSKSDDIPQAEKKFKQLESDEEMARKIQEEWEGEEERNRLAKEKATNEALIRNYDDIKARIEADRLLAEKLKEEEREQFTIEERAKFLHDIINVQRKFLAQQRSKAIRNRPHTKNQLRNQMMTYLKHGGNFKHAKLKIKKFEEIQTLYEKIKRSDEDFISIGSAEDERLIKRMNEKGIDSSKNEMVKEESKEEESTRKRKLGTRKKMKSRKRRFIQNTSEDDSEISHSYARREKVSFEKESTVANVGIKWRYEEDSTMALELIRFVKKLVAELEPEDSNGDEEDL
ncbi:hypothetical protein Tco_1455896 [Tanacetum coccineum]